MIVYELVKKYYTNPSTRQGKICLIFENNFNIGQGLWPIHWSTASKWEKFCQ